MYPRQLFKFGSLLAVLLISATLPATSPAMGAQVTTMSDCEKSHFSGSWISTDKTVPFLSKIDIFDLCKQVTTKPVATNNPWAGDLGRAQEYTYREYKLRPSSTCSPIDCVWGRAKGRIDGNGALTARFAMFFSKRYLTLTRQKQALLVNWRIQYMGGKKPDQIGKTLLVRAN